MKKQYLLVATLVLWGGVLVSAQVPETQKVIIDTDFVVPPQDDGLALLFAVKSPELEILGVTTVAGNDSVERATSDALRVLEIAGRSDIPVYRGANLPLVHEASEWARTVHGNWWSDDPPPVPPGGFAKRQPEKETAVEFLIRTVNANPGKVTIIAIGPLTNVAMALRLEPGLAPKIKKLAIMGGALASLPEGAGNITPNAEFNIWVDPEAAKLVLRAGIPTTLTPLNVTRKTRFSKEWYDKIIAVDSPVTALIKERVGPRFEKSPNRAGPMHDQLAVATVVDPTLVKSHEWVVDVDSNRGPSYGVTVGGPKTWEGSEGARTIAVQYDVDFDRFIKLFVQRLTSTTAESTR